MVTQKMWMFLVLATFFVCVLVPTTSLAAQTECETMYQQAEQLRASACYQEAYDTYALAKARCLAAGQLSRADKCRVGMYQITKILTEYPYTRGEAENLLEKSFPQIARQEREAWFEQGKIDYIICDGKPRYFYDFVANLVYRNPNLQKKSAQMAAAGGTFVSGLKGIIFRSPETGYSLKSWKPYVRPVAFLAQASLVVPRAQLPQSGLLQLWVPLPILTGAQDSVRIISIKPDKYLNLPPQTDEDLGLLYLEVPLDELKQDLEIELQFSFSHYEQRFIVDPANVGEYDTQANLYKENTSSRANTSITPAIRQTARTIVGDEKNPYLAARKLYDYVVENISYSHMPHMSLCVLGKPESEFVHEHSFGDCGAQSSYFSALCRSIGIPARTTGGMQLCPGMEGGHFWAEFYLPNYGWLPVDTSIAQIADYPVKLTNEQRKVFKGFFFGNQDPYRMVIQKDIDVPLTPPPGEPVLLTMAIQFPAAVCDTSDNISFVVSDGWKIEFKPIYQ